MLDLRKFNDVNIDIMWIDGELIKVNQPTLEIMEEVMSIQETDASGITEVMLKAMNNNTSARKFKKAEVRALNMSQSMAIMEELMQYKNKVDTDPN